MPPWENLNGCQRVKLFFSKNISLLSLLLLSLLSLLLLSLLSLLLTGIPNILISAKASVHHLCWYKIHLKGNWTCDISRRQFQAWSFFFTPTPILLKCNFILYILFDLWKKIWNLKELSLYCFYSFLSPYFSVFKVIHMQWK